MAVIVTIGGADYEVPEFNFAALERAWPAIEESLTSFDPIKAPAAGIRIIAAGIMEAENFDPSRFDIKPEENLGEDQTYERVVKFLKKKLLARELEDVRKNVLRIQEEAGLEEAKTGELPAPVEVSPSTETAPPSSPSSSPLDMKEAVGTE